MSNLPATLYFAMTAMPALIAWLSPHASKLKRNLSLCYAISGIMLGLIAITLALPLSAAVKIGAVAVQGGVAGAVMPAAIALLWEAIGRGSSESRRGLALSLAFGVGPLLAVVGSFGQTAVLGGNLFGLAVSWRSVSLRIYRLFGIGVPIMAISAFFGAAVHYSSRTRGITKGDFWFGNRTFDRLAPDGTLADPGFCRGLHARSLAQSRGIRRGMVAAAAFLYHFRSLLQQRVLLIATVVTMLVYSGNVIPSNMNLYSSEALGAPGKVCRCPEHVTIQFQGGRGTPAWLDADADESSGRYPGHFVDFPPVTDLGHLRDRSLVSGRLWYSWSGRAGGRVCSQLHCFRLAARRFAAEHGLRHDADGSGGALPVISSERSWTGCERRVGRPGGCRASRWAFASVFWFAPC
jgi:hypothetical protein